MINVEIIAPFRNNKVIAIDTYEFDTPETINNRIIWALRSLPKYVVTNANPDQPIATKVMYLWSLDPEMMQSSIINVREHMIELLMSVTKKDDDLYFPIERIPEFIHLNAAYQNVSPMGLDQMLLVLKTLVDVNETEILVEFPYDQEQKEYILKKLEREESLFAQEQYRVLSHFREIMSLPAEEVSPFTLSNVTVTQTFSFQGSMYGLFDALQTSPSFPLISFDSYYKVTHGYIPSEEILFPDSHIYILDRDGGVSVEIVPIQNETFSLRKSYKTASVDGILESFRQFSDELFEPINVTGVEPEEIGDLSGFVSVNMTMNSIVFQDVIMNGVMDSFFFVNDNNLNEGDGLKDGLRVYFTIDGSNYMISNMSIRQADKNTLFIPMGVSYLYLTINKAKNIETIDIFRNLIGKVLRVCKNQFTTIQDAYHRYDVDVDPSIVTEEQRSRFLKDVDPLFGGEYSRACQPVSRHPVIIHEGEEYNDIHTFLFPFSAEEGIQQRMYACTSKEYPYPGLIDNKKNKNVLCGLQPCCFKKQKDIKKIYETTLAECGKATVERINQSTYFIKTDKVLEEGQYGVFVGDVDKCFKHCFQAVMIRCGVAASPINVIECICIALGLQLPKEDVMRQRLLPYAHLACQEMYGMTIQDIENYLLNEPLDPRYIIRILEKEFECNLLMFNAESMVLPRNTEGFYSFQRDHTRKTILLYTHASETHSELIVQVTNEEFQARIFEPSEFTRTFDEEEVGYLWNIYQGMTKTYVRNKRIQELPKAFPFRVLSQYVDSKGKVRMLQVSMNGIELVLETSPLPVFDAPVWNIPFEGYVTELKNAYRFAKEIGTSLYQIADSHDKRIVCVGGWFDQDYFQFKINTINRPIRSEYSSFILHRKMASVLQEWVVALYLSLGNISLEAFNDRYLIVDENHVYTSPTEIVDLSEDGNIMKGGAIICTSEMLKLHLYFHLRIFLLRKFQRPATNIIPNFYRSVDDFKQYPNQYLFHTRNDLLNTLTPPNAKMLYHTTKDAKKEPFFYQRNDVLNGQVVLMQRCDDLLEAQAVASDWNVVGYNNIDNVTISDEVVSYYLYAKQRGKEVLIYDVEWTGESRIVLFYPNIAMMTFS